MKVNFGKTLEKRGKNDALCMALIALDAGRKNQSEHRQFCCHSKNARCVDTVTHGHELTYNSEVSRDDQ